MENYDAINAIRRHTLFSVLSESELEVITENKEEISLSRGTRINFGAGLWIILSGKATAYTPDSESSHPLNNFSSGDVIGYASLFDESESRTTVITATIDTSCIFIPEDDIKNAICKNPQFALSLIKTLTNKIRFLSRKTDLLLSDKVEGKVYKYLLGCGSETGEAILMKGKMSAAAKALGIGRASLYRALNNLVDEDKIIITDNGIIIK